MSSVNGAADNTINPLLAASVASGGSVVSVGIGVAGDGVGSVVGGVVAPVLVAAAAAAPAVVSYKMGVRTRILQHTNVIPDLAEIMLSYAAFCGEESLSFRLHNKDILCVAVFPNGNFCTGSDDRTIKIWNREGHCVQTLQGNAKFHLLIS